MVELLLKRHANVKAADRNGKTALDLTQDEAIRAALEVGLQEQEKRQGADKQAKKVRSLSVCPELRSRATGQQLHPPPGMWRRVDASTSWHVQEG